MRLGCPSRGVNARCRTWRRIIGRHIVGCHIVGRAGAVRCAVALLLLCLICAGARADDGPVTKSNAIAVLGKPALPPDFPYFPYVNPNAPKGGEVRLAWGGTFDNFNPFILRGTAPLGLAGSWVILPGGSGSGASVGLTAAMLAESLAVRSMLLAAICEAARPPVGATSAIDMCMNRK